jgi:Family of unknown function (DUF6412)
MRGVRAQAAALLLLGSLLVGSLVVGASGEPALLVGVLGALVCAIGLARHAAALLPGIAGGVPAAAATARRRALAGRAIPRQCDPDAPGHTRSRAPSGLLPAV